MACNEEWMLNAILLATLSMVTGTYWGMPDIYIPTFVLKRLAGFQDSVLMNSLAVIR